MPNLKLGKKPARPGAVRLLAATYLDTAVLPTPPAVFGHQGLIGGPWGMLGNDDAGDCVWAGADHETMLYNAEARTVVTFETANALADYSAVTGYRPDDPDTDQGTDMAEAAAYRLKVGVVDSAGRRHKVAAYLALRKGDVDQQLQAAYVFGAVGFGFEFPASAMDQFDAGQPWDVVPGASIEGGHYVPLVGRAANGNLIVVTWGRLQEMTPAFAERYNDESLTYLSDEDLVDGADLEGFNRDQLLADLRALGHPVVGPEPTPAPGPTPTPVPTPTPQPGDPDDVLAAALVEYLSHRHEYPPNVAMAKAGRAWLEATGRAATA